VEKNEFGQRSVSKDEDGMSVFLGYFDQLLEDI